MTARESGTFPAIAPITTARPSGREGNVIAWVAEAWEQIQNESAAWLWMRRRFSGSLTAGIATYTPHAFGLDRWADWVVDRDNFTFYPAGGQAQEAPLFYIADYLDWQRRYDRGTQTPASPVAFSFSPAGEFCIGPVPDGAYVIRGDYRVTPQILAADTDVPEMPERFHKLIAWEACRLLAEQDEGELHIAVFLRRARQLRTALNRDQLPKIRKAYVSIGSDLTGYPGHTWPFEK